MLKSLQTLSSVSGCIPSVYSCQAKVESNFRVWEVGGEAILFRGRYEGKEVVLRQVLVREPAGEVNNRIAKVLIFSLAAPLNPNPVSIN